MLKVDFIALASVCIVSVVYIYFFEQKKIRRKIFLKEIDEEIKKLKENGIDNIINNERVIFEK